MATEPEVTLQQIRDLLEMLRQTIAGATDLARRVEVLEKASKEIFAILVSLQTSQQKLLEGFQAQSEAQNTLNADLARTVTQLLQRVEQLEGPRQVM